MNIDPNVFGSSKNSNTHEPLSLSILMLRGRTVFADITKTQEVIITISNCFKTNLTYVLIYVLKFLIFSILVFISNKKFKLRVETSLV